MVGDGIITILYLVLVVFPCWLIFKKMGLQGWESLVPGYNLFKLFEKFFGNGWKFLLLMIPIYNIYLAIKFLLTFGKSFHKSTLFIVGMLFMPYIFLPLIAYSDDKYLDGSAAVTTEDFVTKLFSLTPAEKTVFCQECGAKLSADAVFCDECGAKVE